MKAKDLAVIPILLVVICSLTLNVVSEETASACMNLWSDGNLGLVKSVIDGNDLKTALNSRKKKFNKYKIIFLGTKFEILSISILKILFEGI